MACVPVQQTALGAPKQRERSSACTVISERSKTSSLNGSALFYRDCAKMLIVPHMQCAHCGVYTPQLLPRCRAWGGGAFCADNAGGLPPKELDACFGADGVQLPEGSCFAPQIVPNCNNNGDVELPYGSPEYVGLGFSVFATLVIVELFGSPAMRNVRPSPGPICSLMNHLKFGIGRAAVHVAGPLHTSVDRECLRRVQVQVIIGLLVGVIIAAIAGVDGPKYVTGEKIEAAPAATFLWVETFPIGFYAPALLPLAIAFIVTTVESIGDVTATIEASNLPVEVRARAPGPTALLSLPGQLQIARRRLSQETYSHARSRCAGSCCIRASARWPPRRCPLFLLCRPRHLHAQHHLLAGATRIHTHTARSGRRPKRACAAAQIKVAPVHASQGHARVQNNGVISLTRCASRQAGLAAAGWLLLMGIFAKVRAAMCRTSHSLQNDAALLSACITSFATPLCGPLGVVRRELLTCVRAAGGSLLCNDPGLRAGRHDHLPLCERRHQRCAAPCLLPPCTALH